MLRVFLRYLHQEKHLHHSRVGPAILNAGVTLTDKPFRPVIRTRIIKALFSTDRPRV